MVSIHAPVKGATRQRRLRSRRDDVSIHAPVKGATRILPYKDIGYVVSIHAPVKGATVILILIMSIMMFQFTHP